MDTRTLQEILAAQVIELTIDDYGFSGEGFSRVADGWISVPGALPGELVRVRVEDEIRPGQRVYAELLEVLEPADFRRDPLCKRDAVCRGCHLRAMSTDEELRFHVRTVREVLEKYADIPADQLPNVEIITPQPTARGDAYRIRERLTYRRAPSQPQDHPEKLTETEEAPQFELGLTSPVQENLVPMFDCPALTTPVRRLIHTIEEALAALDVLPWDLNMARRASMGLSPLKDAERPDAAAQHPPGAPASFDGALRPAIDTINVMSPVIGRGLVDVRLGPTDDPDLLERAVAEGTLKFFFERLTKMLPAEVGLAVSTAERRAILKDPASLVVPLAGLRIEVGYDDWFPGTLKPADTLYARIMELLALDESDAFLDIGCGIGTISVLASSRAETVTGLDINRASIATAELNAMNNHLPNTRAEAEFIVGSWENALRKLTLAGRKFSAATINPSNQPLGHRALSYLERLELRRLIYLGPSPSSAARDIRELRQMGWTLDTLAAANTHPATYQTMLVARLTRAEER